MSDVPFGAGKWATTADIAANHGHMNVRVSSGLKPGQYVSTRTLDSRSFWLSPLTECLLVTLSALR
jgi:hypothetical protein